MVSSTYAQTNLSLSELPNLNWKKINRYIQPTLFYTHDYLSSTGGEKAGPRNVGALDLFIDSDLSRYSGISGDLRVHYTHINSPDTRGIVGDAQVTSNIEMPSQVDRLTDLYYQHYLSNEFAALFGIHDVSSEFNITSSSLNFIHASFGTGAELATSGAHGPSVYPLSSLGIRTFWKINDSLSLRSGLYDAVVGDESTYRSLHSDVGNHEGYLALSELAWVSEMMKLAVAGWGITKEQESLSDSEDVGNSVGSYALLENKWGNSTWTFLRFGLANPVVTSIQSNLALGAIYQGLIQKRKAMDEIGAGLSTVQFSENLSDETAYEVYYQFEPFKQVLLRPDVQYIQNPSGSTELKDAWMFGMRTVVSL